VFETRVLRKKVGPQTGKVTGEWRKLREFMICTNYYPVGLIKKIKLSVNTQRDGNPPD
jgi:hypothetical protein